jgi:hypothetical protein
MFNVAILGLLLGFSTSFMMAVTLRLAIGLGEFSSLLFTVIFVSVL